MEVMCLEAWLTAILVLLVVMWTLYPGPSGMPTAGNYFIFGQKPHENFLKLAQTRGCSDTFLIQAGLHPVLVLNGHQAIRGYLQEQGTAFTGRRHYILQRLAETNGLSCMDYGKKWQAYHKLTVELLGEIMRSEKMSLLIGQAVSELVTSTRAERGQRFNMQHHLHNCFTQILCSLCFGQHFSRHDPAFYDFQSSLQHFTDTLSKSSHIDWIPWLWYLPLGQASRCRVAYQQLTTATNRLIEVWNNSPSTRAEDGSVASRLTDNLGLAASEMSAILLDWFIYGPATCAASILWALLYSSNQPAIQEKVRKVSWAMGQRGKLSLGQVSSLRYAESVMLETHRLASVLPLALPHTATRDTAYGHTLVPRGSHALVNLWSSHLDPGQWESPPTFDPSRFFDVDDVGGARLSYMPFGVGVRKCPVERMAKTLCSSMSAYCRSSTLTFAPPKQAQWLLLMAALVCSDTPRPSTSLQTPSLYLTSHDLYPFH